MNNFVLKALWIFVVGFLIITFEVDANEVIEKQALTACDAVENTEYNVGIFVSAYPTFVVKYNKDYITSEGQKFEAVKVGHLHLPCRVQVFMHIKAVDTK